jgi:hypothetical protein
MPDLQPRGSQKSMTDLKKKPKKTILKNPLEDSKKKDEELLRRLRRYSPHS